ncbi:MAG: response regulator [Candidatus Hodarchaeales archaeon]
MANVLIVDDSKYLRLMIRRILKRHGHNIIAEAGTGVEAIEQFKLHNPDIITMDVVMPKLNGLQAVKEIMAINPKARIVIVTALGHEPLIRQALKLGAKDFVIKPFKVEQLVQAVEGALS